MIIERDHLLEKDFREVSTYNVIAESHLPNKDKELRMIVSLFPVEQIRYEIWVDDDIKYKGYALQSAIDYYNCY